MHACARELTEPHLHVHVLQAVIDDDAMSSRPEARLRLAVEWNRADVVKRILAEKSGDTAAPAARDLSAAMQVAVERRRVESERSQPRLNGTKSEPMMPVRDHEMPFSAMPEYMYASVGTPSASVYGSRMSQPSIAKKIA